MSLPPRPLKKHVHQLDNKAGKKRYLHFLLPSYYKYVRLISNPPFNLAFHVFGSTFLRMSSVTLVSVTDDDLLQKLKDFNAEIFHEGSSQLRDIKYNWVVPESGRLTQLALHGNEYVGAIVCRLDEDQKVHILTLGVLESHRGQGIGKMLMKHVLKVCSEEQISEVSLDVEVDNEVAIKIYRKYGFTSTGDRQMGRTRVMRMVYVPKRRHTEL